MSKFKKRYVLGEGFPWALGDAFKGEYTAITLEKEARGKTKQVLLNFPEALWNIHVKRYRLVLEMVDEKNNSKKYK